MPARDSRCKALRHRVADLTYVYSDTHAALGKIRRAYACVRTSRTGSTCVTWDYSGTYGF